MLVDLTLILRAKEDAGAIGTPRQNVSAPLQREVVDNFRPDQRIHPLAPIQGCQPLELTRAEQNLPPAAAIATPGTLEAQILRKRERGLLTVFANGSKSSTRPRAASRTLGRGRAHRFRDSGDTSLPSGG